MQMRMQMRMIRIPPRAQKLEDAKLASSNMPGLSHDANCNFESLGLSQ